MREAIITALEDRYNAHISEADATLKIYLENSVGIGEHPQHIEEVDKQIEKIANAEEKLLVLQNLKLKGEKMDDILIISKTQKSLQERLQVIGDALLAGGVDSMENYKYIIGQINALESVRQEISNLLNDKEHNEGTVIDINTQQ